jgi:hypothetical protein
LLGNATVFVYAGCGLGREMEYARKGRYILPSEEALKRVATKKSSTLIYNTPLAG